MADTVRPDPMPDPTHGRPGNAPMRFRLDSSCDRHGRVVIGGSPLRLFRLGAAGLGVVEAIERGDEVDAPALTDRLTDAGAIHPVPPPASPAGRVTIVVPAHAEDPEHLARLRAAAERDGVPVMVIDDASPRPIAGAEIRLERNGGPGVARNAGLEHVTTELVAFVDADVELPAGWLEPLVGHLIASERTALVAPRVRSLAGPGRLARYETERSPLDMGPEPARIRAGTRVSYVPAAAIVCRTDAVRAVGGFDPGLRFGEDVDLVWRLDTAGWACRYEPAVEVTHRPRATWRAWIRQRIGYGSSAAPLTRRHPGALAPVRLHGWSLAAWALAISGRVGPAAAAAVGSAAALPPQLPGVPHDAAFGLALRGNLYAGRTLADAVRRVWWPLLLAAAPRSRLARRALLASVVAAGDPVRVLDDLAYGIGVWRGMARERTLAPIVPEVRGWPERRDVRSVRSGP